MWMTSGLFGPLGSPRYAEYAADINKSGRYLHELITDILDMAKIEAGHRELVREPMDCATEIEDALTMVRQRAESGGVIMQLRQDNALGAVLADRRANISYVDIIHHADRDAEIYLEFTVDGNVAPITEQFTGVAGLSPFPT